MLSQNPILPANARVSEIWYVATTGDDENSCVTSQAPCKTISAPLDKPGFSTGDTILIGAGGYMSNGEYALIIDQGAILSAGWDSTFTVQTFGTSAVQGTNGGGYISSGITVRLINLSFYTQNGDGLENHGVVKVSDLWVWAPNGTGLINAGDFTLLNGFSENNFGPGIVNSGIFSGTNIIVSGNRSGGIANGGVMTLTQSVVEDYGDWFTTTIGNSGALTMRDSVIIDNFNPYTTPATALYNTGSVTFINTTIARSSGGDTTIFNAGGADLHFYNSTFAFNSSGIKNASGGIVTLQNSIFAWNGSNCTGDPIQSLGYNLIDDTTGCIILSTPNDILNVSALIFPVKGFAQSFPFPANEEALFAPLAFSSPAVNGGNPAGCFDDLGNPILTDQRGLPRSGACDIGAYEYLAAYDPLHYSWLPEIFQFPP